MRADIQALRALAVSAVVAFHLWPGRVSGGYVGVDIFFVISGFLITLHLVEKPPTSGRRLADFWARRVRRLIPAAALVLIVTTLASWLWLPSTQFADIGKQVIGSALYVQNWVLSNSATDYLAAENAPTPVQHYWSLSIEEQFYLVWPLIIAAVLLRRRSWLPAVTVALFSASLAWSIYLTSADPGAAYFVTPTRVWELLLGGLVALAIHHGRTPRVGRDALALAGVLMMLVAIFGFDRATAFPGYAALLPTVGAGLVLLAASPRHGPWEWKPVQLVGDWSYPIYLWHWPLIVITPIALGVDKSLRTDAFVLVATVILAGLTVHLIERPLRFNPRLVARRSATFTMLLVTTVVTCSGAVALSTATGRGSSDLVLTPIQAKKDQPVVYADDCWSSAPFTTQPVCHYGDLDSDRRVALLGNSHAGHWQPALDVAAKDRGWALDTYLASQCYTVDLDIAFKPAKVAQTCREWNAKALQRIIDAKTDLVVMSDRTNTLPLANVDPADAFDVAERAYADTLDTLTSQGIAVLVIRDTPAAIGNVPDCVALHEDDFDQACSRPRKDALEPDPLAAAARADDSGLVRVLDVSNRMCDDTTCHVVFDGLIAYFDHGHLTATYSRTLAPEVERAARRAMASATINSGR